MFRTKVLIFMIPLLLPIGQPPAQAVDGRSVAAEERQFDDTPAFEADEFFINIP